MVLDDLVSRLVLRSRCVVAEAKRSTDQRLVAREKYLRTKFSPLDERPLSTQKILAIRKALSPFAVVAIEDHVFEAES